MTPPRNPSGSWPAARTPIVFWGGTGQAKVLAEFIGAIGYRLIAVFENDPQVLTPCPDTPIYYGEDGFQHWRRNCPLRDVACLVAIGGDRGQPRCQLQNHLENGGLSPAIAVHPSAYVAHNARLAKGCQVLANATVGAEAMLGHACLVNTSASVDHECHLGAGVHIGPGATLAGCVTVGDFSFVGAGAVILPRVKIGRNVTVGAGAVVTRSVPDNQVVVGVPAKIERENRHDSGSKSNVAA